MKKHKILIPLIPVTFAALLPLINNRVSYKMGLDYNVPSNIFGGWIGYVVMVCVVVLMMAIMGCVCLKKMESTQTTGAFWKRVLMIMYAVGVILLILLVLFVEKAK